MIAQGIHLIFLSYTILIAARIIGSWFPAFAGHPAMRFVSQYTDPYLNLFRKLIPPIKGVLDLSPMLAYFALQMLEKVVLLIFK